MDTDSRVLQIPIEDIIPNRFQPRLAFDDASLKELADSIKQHGIIQPLVVRRVDDKYEIIAGERRYKAATMAGLTSVPAILSNLDDNASAEVAIVENVQRKDLTAIEEARSFKALLDKGYMTQDDLAKKMGLSQAAISNKLRLLTLDETVQEAVLKEKISERHARSLLKIKDSEQQKQMLSRIINERLTVRQLEGEIKKMNIIPEENDVPLVNNQPDINTIMMKSTDIGQSQMENVGSPLLSSNSINEVKEQPSTLTDPKNLFSNPEQLPNKFFNFLEDEAANMSIEEKPYEFASQIKPANQSEMLTPEVTQPSSNDEIEMLDFEMPTPIVNEVLSSITPLTKPKIVIEESPIKLEDDYLDNIIKTIRNLNLNSDKVMVEEINLPTEYLITIKIKKPTDEKK